MKQELKTATLAQLEEMANKLRSKETLQRPSPVTRNTAARVKAIFDDEGRTIGAKPEGSALVYGRQTYTTKGREGKDGSRKGEGKQIDCFCFRPHGSERLTMVTAAQAYALVANSRTMKGIEEMAQDYAEENNLPM